MNNALIKKLAVFAIFFLISVVFSVIVSDVAYAPACSVGSCTWCSDSCANYGNDNDCDCTSSGGQCSIADGSACDCDMECANGNCISSVCRPADCDYWWSSCYTSYCGDSDCDCNMGACCTSGKSLDCSQESCASGLSVVNDVCGSCDDNPSNCQSDLDCANGKSCNCNGECSSDNCVSGTCQAACTPSCAGKSCGASDGCSGTCGSATDAGCPCNDNNGCTSNDAYNAAGSCVGTNVAAGQDPNNACAASGCSNTGNCNGAGSCQTPAEDTDPNNYCTASGCSNTGNCNGAGSCKTPGAGTDPNSACGEIDCDGGTTKYYWGWDTDNTCYYRSDVTAANAHCDGSSSCKSTATECGEEGKGTSTGIAYHASCRSGCSGTTGPTTANNGASCTTAAGAAGTCSGGSCAAPCIGTVSLTLNPNSVDAGSSVAPSASGLSGCSKAVYFKKDSCTGTQVSSCSSTDTGCTGGSFTAPTSENLYSYFACVDKDSNSDFSGAGESGSATLAVETSSTFPLCSRATPTITSSSWSVANDCWGTPQKSCKNGLSGCSLDCNFAGDYYTTLQSASNDWAIPKGKWKVAAEMKNINSYAKCHGYECIGDDCSAQVASVYLAIGLDSVSIQSQSSSSGAWAHGEGTQEATKSMSAIQFTNVVECTNALGCNLNIRRYLDPYGTAHRMLWPGGGGDYHYQQVAADVSVSLQQVECAVNDNADGTSTECINLYGVSKPVCDTATGLCKNTCTDCANAKSMDKTSISLGETATGTICTISSSNTYDWFKVKANNNGKLIVEMIPSAADLDLEVDKETSIGGGCSNLVWLGKSQNGGANKETVIANAVAGYTYWIKTYYSSGSATGTVTAKLVECTANDALDAACPSAKPYCSNNKCVECYSNTRDDGTSSQCFNKVGYPNQYLTCDLFTYTCTRGPCSENSNCADGYCCDKVIGLSGECVPTPTDTSRVRQPYLCSS